MGFVDQMKTKLRNAIRMKQRQMDMKDQIYLASESDGSWSAFVFSSKSLDCAGALLTTEGQYPAELYYLRTDINGSSILERDICPDRQTLIASLNWIGSCGYSIVSLWDFDRENSFSQELMDIFAASYRRRAEEIRLELLEGLDFASDIDVKAVHTPLSERIETASLLSVSPEPQKQPSEHVR